LDVGVSAKNVAHDRKKVRDLHHIDTVRPFLGVSVKVLSSGVILTFTEAALGVLI
jgi:hypothetical protein